MKYTYKLYEDIILRQLLENQEEKTLKYEENIFLYLCFSILSQQLSVKVASVIRQRFLSLYPVAEPTPEMVAATPVESFRAIGFSMAKAHYVHNVAAFAQNNNLSNYSLSKMSDEEIINYFIQIKGVGRWTVEMLLMFALQRENVFAVDDLGIQTAMCKLYGISSDNKKKMKAEMLTTAKQWEPYRSYACLYLWRFKDTTSPKTSPKTSL
jgi:DNA-3-methyladenine glycosylase II